MPSARIHEAIVKELNVDKKLNELLLQEYINKTNLKIMEIHISKDVRKDRSNERWLNCVLKKV